MSSQDSRTSIDYNDLARRLRSITARLTQIKTDVNETHQLISESLKVQQNLNQVIIN
jgi:hypothetical protein